MDKVELLEKLKAFESTDFNFNEKYHRYTYKSEQFISVTTFLAKFHRKFDFDYWVTKKAEEDGVSVSEKKKEWSDKNNRSNVIGNGVHNWIENYYNSVLQELPVDSDIINRINKFNVIYSTHLHKLTPVKFEQKLFSKNLKIAGMIDSLFLYNGKVIMVDWKTNLKFTTDEDTKFEELLYPFESFYKNHLNEYSIQLSLYSYILAEVGINVEAMYLCYIGPDAPAKMYKAIDMKPELDKLFKDDLFGL
jgi:ATP-dependent exoDNAse (exonuclease V) beta subunit